MKRIISLLFISTILVSCSNDFIDLIPKSTVSIEMLYKTDKDFQDAVIGGYSILQSQYQNMWIYGDVRGDDSETQIIKADAWSYSDLFITTSTDGTLNSTWRNYYSLIFRVNMVLTQIENADPAVVTNKTRHIAEAKFLRALAYFDLVRIFGDVPLVTKPLTAPEALLTPREKVAVVYDLIMSDLMDAEQNLPNSYTGANIGRVTRGAAKTILGKVYLTRHEFGKAESKLQEVTTMGYSLLPVYTDLFDPAKKRNSEYIFDIEYAPGNNITNVFSNRFYPNQAAFQTFYGVRGIGGEANSPTEELRHLFEDHDKRKDITVGVYGGWIGKDGEFIPITASTSMSYTKKYLYPTAQSDDSQCNWHVTRYGDVVLMYAEALNENGKTNEALTWLNMIRTRAGVSTYSGLNQSETREAIYTERRFELSFEGHRWFDLVRYGRAYEKMAPKGMKPHMTVFPIPWSQIQVVNNKAILWQNEGYS